MSKPHVQWGPLINRHPGELGAMFNTRQLIVNGKAMTTTFDQWAEGNDQNAVDAVLKQLAKLGAINYTSKKP